MLLSRKPATLDDLPSRLAGLGAPPPTLSHYDQLLAAGTSAVSAPAKVQAMEALIDAHARELHLPTVRARFRGLAEEATRDQQTPTAYLAALLEAEVSERAERRERRRLIDARFPLTKRLEDFQFDENPKIPQATIAALAQGTWIDDRESVILLGDSGDRQDTLGDLPRGPRLPARTPRPFHHSRRARERAQAAESRRELGSVVARYARTEVVVLDELGYLALPDGAAELVFQVISERNERGSLIVTTNLPFGEWTKVFPDARLAKAVVDRITHRAHIIDTGNESWRFNPASTAPRRSRLTPHHDAAPAITRSATRYALRSTRHRRKSQTEKITHTTTDAKWGHFKPPRRGQCKPPRPRWAPPTGRTCRARTRAR